MALRTWLLLRIVSQQLISHSRFPLASIRKVSSKRSSATKTEDLLSILLSLFLPTQRVQYLLAAAAAAMIPFFFFAAVGIILNYERTEIFNFLRRSHCSSLA